MQIKNIRLLNFGSITAINEARTLNKESLTGYFLHSDRIKFINHKDTLEGKIGLSFGVEYYLEGFNTKSKLEDVHFISKIIHPLLTNPVNKENTTETLEQKYDYLNQINYDYFSFEYDWEIKPGLWIFQLIEANTILFEKVFNII
jgi:hypothetical protein